MRRSGTATRPLFAVIPTPALPAVTASIGGAQGDPATGLFDADGNGGVPASRRLAGANAGVGLVERSRGR